MLLIILKEILISTSHQIIIEIGLSFFITNNVVWKDYLIWLHDKSILEFGFVWQIINQLRFFFLTVGENYVQEKFNI